MASFGSSATARSASASARSRPSCFPPSAKARRANAAAEPGARSIARSASEIAPSRSCVWTRIHPRSIHAAGERSSSAIAREAAASASSRRSSRRSLRARARRSRRTGALSIGATLGLPAGRGGGAPRVSATAAAIPSAPTAPHASARGARDLLPPVRRAAAHSSARASAVLVRRSRTFSSAWKTTAFAAPAFSGRGAGGLVAIAWTVSRRESPWKGGVPARSSKRIAPRAHTSERGSRSCTSPSACSGER